MSPSCTVWPSATLISFTTPARGASTGNSIFIDTSTMTGRLCYPITDLFLTQWDEQRRLYPRSLSIGPLL